MTIDFTRPDTTSFTQRNSFMAALSLTETLLSETTAVPTSVDIQSAHWSPEEPVIRIYFHDDPAGAREFAGQFFLEVTDTVRPDRSVYTEASGQRDGVAVQAWALLSAEQAAAVAA